MGKEVTGHWKKLVSDPKFLGEADFEKGQEIAATISMTTSDEVTSERGKEQKTVLNFAENIKPLILNATNSKTIVKLTGQKEVQNWKGARVQIYYDPTIKFGREIVGGVRIRPFAPKAAPKPTGDPIKCEMCQSDIKPFGKMNTEQMAEYTAKTYGKKMCADCATQVATKLKEENSNENNENQD